MALVLKDRVKETTTSTGTGAVTLDGASTGFQGFDAVGNFNQTYYTITDGTNWEAGIGTFGELESSAALSLAFDETTTLDNRITFTRATNGTYFDSSGVLQTASSGVARFDHRLEGGVWVNKGLLIEEQRTNVCLRSEEFSTTWVTTNSTVTTNATTAPDGNTTADQITDNATNGGHNVSQTITGTAPSQTLTASVYIKNNNVGWARILIFNSGSTGNQVRGWFDIANGTIGTVDNVGNGTGATASIENVGDGWYRCTLSGKPDTSGSNTAITILTQTADGQTAYVGTGQSMYVWGAQLEAGAFPTSYIATTSASVTRNADVASMTSTNFSSWYNATEGTVLWQGDMAGTVASVGNWFWNINDNTANEQLTQFLFLSSGTYQTRTQVVDGGVGQLAPLTQNVSFAANQTYKTSFGYKVNDFASSTDGSAAATDTSGSLPTVDRILFGSRVTGINYLNGHIAKFYYWNTRLSNGTLQYLSSSFGSPSISRRLNRDTVLASSNSGNLVNFSAGTKTVFSPLPAIATQGSSATGDNSSIGTDLVAWNNFKKLLDKSVIGGVAYGNNGTNGIVSTYSLVYTGSSLYRGGVLSQNGDVNFVPGLAVRGQKVSSTGVVSTYALVYTLTASSAYFGGVLAPNGDTHFVPLTGAVGQKISASGVVSTYSLVYTTTNAYAGGVLAPNGEVQFIPYSANRGQKISAAGVVSTYSLVYTTAFAYIGGVLAPNGDIHFIPSRAAVGQKISAAGVVSTYSLVYTGTDVYESGVISPNGDIHFVPRAAAVGQKISAAGVVSTYSLVYTSSAAYQGGVLAPNGDIHFVPLSAPVGQKISASGVVSTYSLAYTVSGAYSGGILRPDGSIIFIPGSAAVGQIIHTNPGIALGREACLSSYLNKF